MTVQTENSSRPVRRAPGARRSWITPRNAPYAFLAPVVLVFLAFKFYPVCYALWLSFTKNVGGVAQFIGLENYARIFRDSLFGTALFNTAVILVVQVPIMIALAIVLALAFNPVLLKARAVFRLGYFLPVVMGLVAYGVLFRIMLNTERGVVNGLLNLVGIGDVPWLGDSFWAKISIALAMTWHYTGINAVIFLAQRQSIPDELYEAASVDGAGAVQKFWHVTLPGLKPAVLLTVITSTIGTLQLFDEPYILTNGGPANATLTLGLYLYQQGFKYFNFGYASTIGWVLVIIVVIISVVQFRLLSEKER